MSCAIRNRSFTRHLAPLALGALLAQAALAGGPLKAGDPLPAMRADWFEGALPALRGQVVLIDFWASWCGPCRKSFPALESLHQAYRQKGLVVLGVNIDEKKADMDRFLGENRATFPIVRDRDQKFVEFVSVETMPTSLLIDRSGRVRVIHNGFKGEETATALRAEVERLLAEAAPAGEKTK
jgi:thiol-disulfide isomerase/thioredoxin